MVSTQPQKSKLDGDEGEGIRRMDFLLHSVFPIIHRKKNDVKIGVWGRHDKKKRQQLLQSTQTRTSLQEFSLALKSQRESISSLLLLGIQKEVWSLKKNLHKKHSDIYFFL